MQNKDDNAVLKRVEFILENPRYTSSKKLSPEHTEELKKVIRSSEAVAFVLSGLCDVFDKAYCDAAANAKSLVELVRLHKVDLEKGTEMMAYLANVIETEEAELKCIN